MKSRLFLTSIISILFLIGCQQTEPTEEGRLITQTDITTDIQEDNPYPYPETETDLEPYIAPEKPTQKPYIFRKSREGLATIHGVLFVIDPDQGMPQSDDAIFLVPLPESEGVTMVPTFEIGTVPQADVDERTGEFVFTDIEPGLYIVMVYTIGNAQIPARTEEGGFAIFKIEEADRDQLIEVNYLLVP